MTTTASPATIAGYIHAMMQACAPNSAPGMRIVQWLRCDRLTLAVDVDAELGPHLDPTAGRHLPAADKPLPPWAWEAVQATLARVAAAGDDSPIERNIAALAAAVGIDGAAAQAFRFVFHASCEYGFDDLCNDIVRTRATDSIDLTASALRCRPGEVRALLARGPVQALGLVTVNAEAGLQFSLAVPERIRRALQPPNDGLADIERQLIGVPRPARLALADFDHVAKERDFILRLLEGATRMRRPGVNILLYGPPGTGKTELCKAIATALDLGLFAVGETDEYGDEPTRGERVDALRLADRLAARRAGAVLLFDEMEDVLQQGERSWSRGRQVRRAGSKAFFNRLLEQNAVPVLWTANSLCEFDPAFLRRMSFACEIPAPPASVRERLWQGFARRSGLDLPAEQSAALARRFKVAPSLMESATQAVAAAGGTADEIDFAVSALARPLVGRLRPAEAPAPAGFAPELANADADLDRLLDSLTRAGAPRDMTLCLYGPPGTGKSAFARRLADGMGLDPLVKRGSDLLSMWIGESERLIAEAFEEALKEERFLIIDEAEAFLWNRAGASKSWEVSMVNELLVCMETHPLPFACTTNHLEQIDPAALRRFTFKVKFDYMTPAQTAAAYRCFFGRAAPPGLRDLAALTPGDFAAVARKLRHLGDDARSDGTLLCLLEQEMAVKNLPLRIGF